MKPIKDYLDASNIDNFTICEAEETVWLVSILFTEEFYMKNMNFNLYSGDNYAQYFANVTKFVNSDEGAKKALQFLKQEYVNDEESDLDDVNLRKIASLDALKFLEGKGIVVPEKVINAAKRLVEIEYHRKSSAEEQARKYPDLSKAEFEKLAKQPLWSLCKAILYINGIKSDEASTEIVGFIKRHKDLEELSLYITQAHITKKLELIKSGLFDSDEIHFDIVYSTSQPNYEMIRDFSIEPKVFIGFAKKLPLLFPILEENYKAPEPLQANSHEIKPINPKKKKSMNKLILAMAIKKYGYNPNSNKNNATANIETTLNNYGLSMDKNTIRTCLKEAYEDLEDEIILDNGKN